MFLTGDIHSSWASDIPFLALARHEVLHAPARALIDEGENLLRAVDHWFKWIYLRCNGFMAVEVNKRGTQCDWHFVENVLTPDTPLWLEKSFVVRPGFPGRIVAS